MRWFRSRSGGWLLRALAAVAGGCSPAGGNEEAETSRSPGGGGSANVALGGSSTEGGAGDTYGTEGGSGNGDTGGAANAGTGAGGTTSSGGAATGGMSAGGAAAAGAPSLPDCGAPPEWAPGTSYTTGQIVHYSSYCSPENSGYYIVAADNPGYDPVESSFFWRRYQCAGGIQDGGADPSTTPGCVLDTYLPEKSLSFRKIFCSPFQGQVIHDVFKDAYNDACEALAVGSLSSFGKGGTEEQNRQEIAGFLANVAVETAYLQDSAEGGVYGANDFRGRGVLQLTGQNNYQLVAGGLGNPSIANTPNVVESDPELAWQTGFWFWLNFNGSGLGTPQSAMYSGNFGLSVRIIKGNCDRFESDRMPAYTKACSILGITPMGTSCS